MSTTFAIIPARGGSKGVPGKNIRLLAGHPLIAYSIAAAKISTQVSRTIISTDSDEIAEICRDYDAEVPFLRPSAISGDRSTDREFVLHTLDWLAEHTDTVPDYLVHLRPTTPLRDPWLLDEAITILLSDSDATSLRSAHEVPESPFKWFMLNEHGHFYGFNPGGILPPGYANLPRQNFPLVYVPDGYVDVLRTSFLLTAEDIHGPRIRGYISPTCREVDAVEDFDYLEFQLKTYGSPLLDYLNTRN